MKNAVPSDPIYHDEHAARVYLESHRWPDGPVCPHCGAIDNAAPLCGKSTRPGVWKCRKCRKPFSCTIGTVYERSKIALSTWLLTMYLMEVRVRGVSSRQLHLRLGVSYKTALYMMHRIRTGSISVGQPCQSASSPTVRQRLHAVDRKVSYAGESHLERETPGMQAFHKLAGRATSRALAAQERAIVAQRELARLANQRYTEGVVS